MRFRIIIFSVLIIFANLPLLAGGQIWHPNTEPKPKPSIESKIPSKPTINAGNNPELIKADENYKNGSYSQALALYLKYSQQLNSKQFENIAWMYNWGLGVQQDYSEAMKWYKKAADLGNNNAMSLMGLFYEFGNGVTLDYAEAMKWYLRAENLGNSRAMYDIGTLYQFGKGVPKDISKAVTWYKKAAHLGNQDARERLKNLGY